MFLQSIKLNYISAFTIYLLLLLPNCLVAFCHTKYIVSIHQAAQGRRPSSAARSAARSARTARQTFNWLQPRKAQVQLSWRSHSDLFFSNKICFFPFSQIKYWPTRAILKICCCFDLLLWDIWITFDNHLE